ncbi:MAG: type II toxin-antitoxin system prevent-host-death family antitoxin [Clostridiales Family XIII bacterium]|nr:type II toxin-antitoxin system prevent-host-death family antitoxin [Clostridiales Family XIII bacterium]
MQFVTVRDFRNSSREIWDKLSKDEEIVVTNNGKPTALLMNITENNFEDLLAGVRQAKAAQAFNRMREESARRGFMSGQEIEDEIQAARKEARERGETL